MAKRLSPCSDTFVCFGLGCFCSLVFCSYFNRVTLSHILGNALQYMAKTMWTPLANSFLYLFWSGAVFHGLD